MSTTDPHTAAVRVLMVGSWQVTSAVFEQLDWAAPDGVEPLGRVCDDEARSDEVVVAARDRRTGALVRFSVRLAPEVDVERDRRYEPWKSLPLIVLAEPR